MCCATWRFGSIVLDWYVFFCVTHDWLLQHSALRIAVQLMPVEGEVSSLCDPTWPPILCVNEKVGQHGPCSRWQVTGNPSGHSALGSEARRGVTNVLPPNFAWLPFGATGSVAGTRLGRQTFALTKRSTDPPL